VIVFFISGHGFGHASRQVEIINALGAARPDLPIGIRSAVNAELLARTLRVPYQLWPGDCDSGIVQTSSIAHDDEATIRDTLGFYATFDERVERELQLLPRETRLIVGDIPPLAFAVAARRGVASVAISNFTWDWIYEDYAALRDAPGLLARLRDAYRQATFALQLPMAGGFEVFNDVRAIPFVARHATRLRDETRAHFGVPLDKPAALLSFGGYGLPRLRLADLDCLGEWTIITTDRASPGDDPQPAGVIRLAERDFSDRRFRYEDIVSAADVVVTKPGYGIIAECVAANTAMLYTSRGQFREYDLLVREFPRYVRSRFISQDDLFAGRWRDSLEALLTQPAPAEVVETNGADIAAQQILLALHYSSSTWRHGGVEDA